MTEIATISFKDQAENDEACAIVKVEGGIILLTFTIEHGGDLDIAMTPADCKSLHKQLGEEILTLQPNRTQEI
jgi:hypothetical protein